MTSARRFFGPHMAGVSMGMYRSFVLALALVIQSAVSLAWAQDINLQPKYGLVPKSQAQLAADAQFLAAMDQHYQGNRKKAAADAADRGWQALRQGKAPDAMRRFNQAWLLDHANGSALWDMATVGAGSGRVKESLKLFGEAERYAGADVDLVADHAKALGIVGAQTQNKQLLNEAFARFARVHEKAPSHTLNLQNWAITLFFLGNYAESWKKIKLAESTPRRAEIDQSFVATLHAQMPRP